MAGDPPSSSGRMSSSGVNGIWVIHQSIQYGESQKLVCSQRQGTTRKKAEQ